MQPHPTATPRKHTRTPLPAQPQGTLGCVPRGMLLHPAIRNYTHLYTHSAAYVRFLRTFPPHLQGTFNGVSSGMLLYIALVQLLAEDMGRFTPGRANAAIRLGCFAALCCGAACMCLLAVWA